MLNDIFSKFQTVNDDDDVYRYDDHHDKKKEKAGSLKMLLTPIRHTVFNDQCCVHFIL